MIQVMSMNPQGNQPPLDYGYRERRYGDDRLVADIDTSINPSDVLCGRGKSSFTHVGNRRFRDIITNSIDEYNNSESRVAKSRVVQRIVENIKGEGGRFLKRDRVKGGWTELDTKSCRDKVGHAIRDAANLIESRKAKRERRKKTLSEMEEEGKTVAERQLPSFEESKLPSRFEDDDIFYDPFASEAKQVEEVDLEQDSFVQHINHILGPLEPGEAGTLADFDHLERVARRP